MTRFRADLPWRSFAGGATADPSASLGMTKGTDARQHLRTDGESSRLSAVSSLFSGSQVHQLLFSPERREFSVQSANLNVGTNLNFVIASKAVGPALRLDPKTNSRKTAVPTLQPFQPLANSPWKRPSPLCHPERSRGTCSAPFLNATAGACPRPFIILSDHAGYNRQAFQNPFMFNLETLVDVFGADCCQQAGTRDSMAGCGRQLAPHIERRTHGPRLCHCSSLQLLGHRQG